MRRKKTKAKPKTKSRQFGRRDPHANREAARYEHPIPSRELILSLLEERAEPLWLEQIAEALHLTSEKNQEALRRRLQAMVRDGQLLRNRRDGYVLVDKSDLVCGRVIGHADGYGFLAVDDGGDDLYLSARQMRSLFHGDRVMARVAGVDRRGRREGAVVEILERNTQQVVGRYYQEGGVGWLVPDNKRIAHKIAIPKDQDSGAKHGQFVTVEIIEQPTKRAQPVGRIMEVIGDHMGPGMEIDVAIRAHGVPLAWPDDVQEEIAGLGKEVPASAKRGRVDIRDLPLVTIDGEDARDFDDAVYCERKPKGWRLLVAIADVSHYVRPGTALDNEALQRGNSVYFPERVIPMLPEVLSNGLCSINPGVDRLCMVCEMNISSEGKITRSRFFEGLMRSHARLTYTQVASVLVDHDKSERDRIGPVVPHLEELYLLYKVLVRVRRKRGAIDFDTTETRIVFGADRKIESVVPVVRNEAHKIIEECMIAANVSSGRFLARHKVPTLYRVHEGPKADKLTDLREFLKELGLSLRGAKQPQAKHYADLLRQVSQRPDAHLIQTVMLRSLSQARYSPDNIGHFGLAHECYLHFTSPIRRYPDLLVHRAIRHVLRRKPETAVKRLMTSIASSQKKVAGFSYKHDDMQAFGEHCSTTERRADDAVRDAIDWLKCEYMQDKVGESYEGIITGVTGFGVFVELAKIYVEGLVHITALRNDYYHFEPAGHRLVGERTRTIYRLGDSVNVKLVRVDLDERKIDFELVDSESKKAKAKSRGRRADNLGGKRPPRRGKTKVAGRSGRR